MISRLRCIDPDDEPDERALARKRASRTMRRRTETYAMHWQLLRAFMQLSGCTIDQNGNEVSTTFKTSLEAEQLYKLLNSAKGK